MQRVPKGQWKNGQPRETGNIGHTRQEKQNKIFVGHHYLQTTYIRHDPPTHKQLETKSNRTSCLCGNQVNNTSSLEPLASNIIVLKIV